MKLRTKLLAFSLPLIVVCVVLVPNVARVAVQDIVKQEMVKRGIAATKAAAANSSLVDAFHSGDEIAFMGSLQNLQMQTQALSALALDKDGRVIAHTNVGERNNIHGDSLTLAAMGSDAPLHQFVEEFGSPSVAIFLPVWGSESSVPEETFLLLGEEGAAGRARLGTLRLALPLRDALETGGNISTLTFWILTATGSLVLALSLLFTGQVLRPIRLLARATERLGRGSIGEMVPVSSTDEIGDLGRRFNQMSKDLAETTVSKELLDRTLGNMLDAVIVTDAEGRMRTLNSSAVDLLGCSAEEMTGRRVFDILEIFPADGEPAFDITLARAPVANREGRLISKAGTSMAVLVNVSALNHDDGSTGHVISARNIEAWKQAEEARLSAERELEQQKAVSMHSDRLRSLGEMAAGIAHELNQPLTGVRGLAEHILINLDRGWDLPEEKLRERIGGIIDQSDRMVHIIQHVRMFAREAGSAERSQVQINEVVQSAMELVGMQLKSHGVELLINLEESLPPVRANPYSLEEVLINLVNNARDALVEERAQDGNTCDFARIEIATRLVNAHQDSPQICVEVADNGPGIPVEVIDNVFEPFFTTKDPVKGTGLGLAISRSIIEDLGGDIGVLPVSNGGTTFAVLLPAAGAE